MRKIEWTFCPKDAPQIVKDEAYCTLKRNGGENFIVELFESLETLKLIPICPFDEVIDKIYALDAKEKF